MGTILNEVMNMKKFLSGVKKNIFYVSLIAGMAVLVTVVGLYNAQTNSKEEAIVIGEGTQDGDASEPEGEAKETLSDRAKTAEDTAVATETEISGGADTESTETTKAQPATEESMHYDPKNSIEWPLTGNVIIPYSMDTTVYFETLKTYKCSPAMVIEAEKGAEVKAVYDCKVSEVSSSPELGNFVVLELGDGYTVTLGQLEEVKVALGTKLSMGDVVGTVGEPSRFYAEEGTSLYFAVEKDGEPVDPMLLVN